MENRKPANKKRNSTSKSLNKKPSKSKNTIRVEKMSYLSKSKVVYLVFSLFIILLVTVAFIRRDLFIVATVDGKPITRLNLIKELENRAGGQVLDELILKKTIESEASKSGVTVSEKDIDEEIKKIEQDVKKQGGTLDQMLSLQGITKKVLRENLRFRLLLLKIMGDKVKVTDEEVNNYIEQNKESLPKGKSDDELKSYVKDLLQQQKYSSQINSFLEDLKSKHSISNYYNRSKK